jgi:tetratricopeptide (TPR) repeat protein
MQDRSNTKNPTRFYAHRAGNARLSGVLLGIGAFLAACVAAYALWTLTQSPTGTKPAGAGDPNDPAFQGIAQTESIEEILGAVQVYVRNEQYPQATTVLEGAVAQYPSDQELRLALGDLYMLQRRYIDAYAHYVAGIGIGPSTATMEFTAGTLANMLDQLELAEAHFSASMQMDSSNPDTPIFLAAIQMKLNRFGEAKANLALAGRLAPDRAKIYVMRSDIAMRENHVQIALEQIRKARAIEPRELAWVLQEARVLKRAGKAQDAINLLASLDQETLDLPETAYLYAQCLGMVDRPGDAASRLMDVAAKRPADAKLAFEVALWLERAGEREEAIEWAKKAQRLGYTQAQAWVESLP